MENCSVLIFWSGMYMLVGFLSPFTRTVNMLVDIPFWKVEMWIEFLCVPRDYHHQSEGLVSLHGWGAVG